MSLQHLLDVAGSLSYVVVFIGVGIESMGVPIPGETILVLGAILAGQGKASAAGVAAAGWAGAVLGDNIGYWAGREFGPRLVTLPVIRHIFDERRAAVAQRFFQRRHAWVAVFAGRFIAILRIFAGPLAGWNKMRYPVFFAANASGGACWVAVVVSIGVVLGSRGESIVKRVGYFGLAGAVALGIGVYLLHRRRVARERAEGERLVRSGSAPGGTD